MDAETQLAGFLATYTPEMKAFARDVRARLEKRMPTALQMVYDNDNGLVIGFSPSDRPLDAVLSMMVLPDPDGDLAGRRQAGATHQTDETGRAGGESRE